MNVTRAKYDLYAHSIHRTQHCLLSAARSPYSALLTQRRALTVLSIAYSAPRAHRTQHCLLSAAYSPYSALLTQRRILTILVILVLWLVIGPHTAGTGSHQRREQLCRDTYDN